MAGTFEWKHAVQAIVHEGNKGHEISTAGQQYRDFCDKELELLSKGVCRRTWQGDMLAIKTREDLVKVMSLVREKPERTKHEIRQLLESDFSRATEASLNSSLDLAARLWLMINFQDKAFATLRMEATCVAWHDGDTLQSCVQKLFPPPRWEVNAVMNRLSPYFKATFLTEVCGLKLVWTPSLADHLRIDRHQKSLRVFPYKKWLQSLLEGDGVSTAFPLSRDLISETMRSLDLLFPVWDADTGRLLKKENQPFHETTSVSPSLAAGSLLDFHYWRDRLLELRGELDAPPASWAQLWKDRRHPQQFWTFWIALIILILTCLSLVMSIIQAWASLEALNLALEATFKGQKV